MRCIRTPFLLRDPLAEYPITLFRVTLEHSTEPFSTFSYGVGPVGMCNRAAVDEVVPIIVSGIWV
jgi:hypothetical protein